MLRSLVGVGFVGTLFEESFPNPSKTLMIFSENLLSFALLINTDTRGMRLPIIQ